MTEVGQRFSTRTEERLLAVVYTLQQRTYKTGLPANAAVPEVFKKELAGEVPAHLSVSIIYSCCSLQPSTAVSQGLFVCFQDYFSDHVRKWTVQGCAKLAVAVMQQALASWHTFSSSSPKT